ncbi:MAG: MmgE/PrpD family protein [Spirochaetales bacterium]|uniref:MmgE/PrpD family protein n=1 Tax=Candidatus Thalassospirochaeta sargassi TaxID=3119039 RepID=A0AAJ1MLY0_9SPIO|nr:MmgE/PrpD family protein [Spirochaetales bacterium]
MSNNITDIFIEDLFALSNSNIPTAVLQKAKNCVLDYLGVTFAGAKILQEKGNKYLEFQNDNSSIATVIGFNRKASIFNSIIVNGLSSHVLELDDGDRYAMLHPGVPVISALLAVAEAERVDSDLFLKAVVIGYEATIRIARVMQPSLKLNGYHGTGVCGTIGVAIACAAVLGFTIEEMKNALSAAATGSGGLLKVLDNGSELKPLNVARAALNGYIAASIAKANINGPDDVLGGSRGFLSVFSNRNDITKLKRNNDRFAIEDIYIKPYAACRHSHSAVEAVLNIRKEHQLNLNDIKNIFVRTYKLGVEGHDHIEITDSSSAKMSTPYSVAAALVTGKSGISEFLPEQIENQEILKLLNIIEIKTDAELSQLVPRKRPAIVEIHLQDGSIYSNRVDLPKGEPENPVFQNELIEKFCSLALYGGKTQDEADKTIKILMGPKFILEDLFLVL